jgi:hypothetical protein
MQNADSNVSSPTPSSSGFKRKRTGSLNAPFLPPGNRTKKIPREDLQDEEEDVEMEDVPVTPPGMVNGTGVPAAAIAAATKALSDSEEWQKTIERIVKSVVAIRFCQVCVLVSGGDADE